MLGLYRHFSYSNSLFIFSWVFLDGIAIVSPDFWHNCSLIRGRLHSWELLIQPHVTTHSPQFYCAPMYSCHRINFCLFLSIKRILRSPKCLYLFFSRSHSRRRETTTFDTWGQSLWRICLVGASNTQTCPYRLKKEENVRNTILKISKSELMFVYIYLSVSVSMAHCDPGWLRGLLSWSIPGGIVYCCRVALHFIRINVLKYSFQLAWNREMGEGVQYQLKIGHTHTLSLPFSL